MPADLVDAPDESPFYRIPTRDVFDAVFASQAHDVDAAYQVLTGESDPCEVSESTRKWERKCFHRPNLQELALHAIDALVGTSGVEAIYHDDWGDPTFEYLNTGDTYAATLLVSDGDAVIGCWGDVVEALESGSSWDDYVEGNPA